jgi:hypothetical protein
VPAVAVTDVRLTVARHEYETFVLVNAFETVTTSRKQGELRIGLVLRGGHDQLSSNHGTSAPQPFTRRFRAPSRQKLIAFLSEIGGFCLERFRSMGLAY